MEKQEIQHLLEEEFEVEYHPNYLPTFLDELRLHYAIPRTKRPDRPENAEEILDERVKARRLLPFSGRIRERHRRRHWNNGTRYHSCDPLATAGSDSYCIF